MINPLSNIFKTIKGTVLDNISVIYCFKDYEKSYYRFVFYNGSVETYSEDKLIISENILND